MSSTKHFLNDPTGFVNAALKSLAIHQPQRVHHQWRGSGHEPSFGAFVGHGLLTVSVAGTVFASPATKQIRAALQDCVGTENGILVIIMNYTGDVLNFGVTVEQAKATGLNVNMLVIGDDVGVPKSRAGKVGRRGIAGTVLVHKITGALARHGASLQSVSKVGEFVSKNLVSIGASLERVHVPGHGAAEGQLAEGELELGMGIHNEQGAGKIKVDLPYLVETMLTYFFKTDDPERSFLRVGSNEVVLMINNLGGLSVLELGGITTEVTEQLEKPHKIKPVRVYAGTFMTSLNMLGFSISILNVGDTGIGGPGMVELLDAPSEAAGWSAFVKRENWESKNVSTRGKTLDMVSQVKPSGLNCDLADFEKALKSGLEAVIASEPEVTKYDTAVGDGDCGTILKRGAEGILSSLFETRPDSTDVVVLISKITSVVEETMDGTSGALYTIFLSALITSLCEQSASVNEITVDVWVKALEYASSALSTYTPASAAEASLEGALKTKSMMASLGRSVYVGEDTVKDITDPGAWGLCQFFLGLAKN